MASFQDSFAGDSLCKEKVAMKILENFIVLGANCKFIDAFYGIIFYNHVNAIESMLAGPRTSIPL